MSSAPSHLPAAPHGLPRWPLFALIFGSSLLAFGPMLVRLADVNPVASAFWRMGLATPVLLALALRERQRSPAKIPWPWAAALLSGGFFAADLVAWHLGIVRTTAANATLFGNTAAFMLAGWAVFVHRETPGKSVIRALALAGAGSLLLLGRSAQLSSGHLAGDLLSILAAAFYTGYFLVVMRLRSSLSTLNVLALTTAASALLLLPIALLAPGAFWPTDWRPVAALAVCSQLAGQGLLVFASGKLPAPVIGIGLLVQPLVAALTGWLAFGETLGPVELAGAALIATALVLVRR